MVAGPAAFLLPLVRLLPGAAGEVVWSSAPMLSSAAPGAMTDDARNEPAAAPPVPAAAVAAHPHRAESVRPEHLYKTAGLLLLLALVFHFFDTLSRTFLLAYAAALGAVLLNVVVRLLPLQRKWVAALIGVLVVGGVAAGLWFGVPLLLDQARGLVMTAPEFERLIEQWEQTISEQTGIPVDIPANAPSQLAGALGGQGGAVLGRALNLVEILFVPLIIFFGALFALANPNDRLLNPLLRMAPHDRRPAFYRIFQLLGERLLGWIKGTLTAMLAVGVLSVAAFWFIGVPNALLLGLINGLLEFIPLLGPWVGGATATIVAFLDDPQKGLWTAIAVLAIQQLEANLITPWAMAANAELHPFITLFALVLFGGLFGFLGVLLAIPLAILVWTVVQVLWVERAIDTDRDRITPVVAE